MSWRPLVCKKCPEDMSADLLQKVSNKQKWNNNWSAWVVCSHLHCWYQVMAFSNILNFRKLLMHISIVLQQAKFLVYLFITSVNHVWKLMPESNLKMLLYPIAVIMTSSKDFGDSKLCTAWITAFSVRLPFIKFLPTKENERTQTKQRDANIKMWTPDKS